MTTPDLYAIQHRLGGVVSRGGQTWQGPGPGHSRHDKSLKVDINDDERVLIHSFAGDSLGECERHLGIRAGEAGHQAAFATKARPRTTQDVKPDPAALDIWNMARPAGDVVLSYLTSRAITAPPPDSLRQGSGLVLGRTPCCTLVAALSIPWKGVVAVQQTFLTWSGRKAPVREPRKTIGRLYNGAVRLGRAEHILGLAEGIETGLSAQQLTGIPVWCSLGSRLDSVDIPPSVNELHVFADNDSAGQKAAARTADRWSAEGVTVKIRTPIDVVDWNDVLQSLAREAA